MRMHRRANVPLAAAMAVALWATPGRGQSILQPVVPRWAPPVVSASASAVSAERTTIPPSAPPTVGPARDAPQAFLPSWLGASLGAAAGGILALHQQRASWLAFPVASAAGATLGANLKGGATRAGVIAGLGIGSLTAVPCAIAAIAVAYDRDSAPLFWITYGGIQGLVVASIAHAARSGASP